MDKYNNKEGMERKRQLNVTSSNYIDIDSPPYICRLLGIKLLERLKEAENSIPIYSKKQFIPISVVYQKICRCFGITKQEARELLSELRRKNYLEFIGYKGVKLNYKLTA